MEFDLMLNCVDVLSMIGIVYEVVVLYNIKMIKLEIILNEFELFVNDELIVIIENEDKVLYYSVCVVYDVIIEFLLIWM